jgi:hypothetical protein
MKTDADKNDDLITQQIERIAHEFDVYQDDDETNAEFATRAFDALERMIDELMEMQIELTGLIELSAGSIQTQQSKER